MYTNIIDNTEDSKGPVIYKIEIGSPGTDDYLFYIGKSSNGVSRPLKTYPKCVDNYKNNKFRTTSKKIDGKRVIVGTRPSWRKHVHVPLHEAVQSNRSITLTMINVSAKELDTIEKSMILEFVTLYGKEKTMNKEFVK